MSKPNILWISTHDTSAWNYGCYGDRYAQTPNIDRLAAEGVTFTAGPTCSPSRTSIYTGMHPTTLGTHHHRSAVIRPAGVELLPKMLTDAGYACTEPDGDINLYVSKEECEQYYSSGDFWEKRPEDKPFFSYYKLGNAHVSVFKMTPDGAREERSPLLSDILWTRLRAGAYLSYCNKEQLRLMKPLIPVLKSASENQGIFGPEHDPYAGTNHFIPGLRDMIGKVWVIDRVRKRIELS